MHSSSKIKEQEGRRGNEVVAQGAPGPRTMLCCSSNGIIGVMRHYPKHNGMFQMLYLFLFMFFFVCGCVFVVP